MFKHINIRSYEIGLLFRDREFQRLLEPGSYWLFDIGWLLPWRGRLKADIVSKRDPWLLHEKLDLIVRSGVLKDRAIVLDLKDYERRWSGSTVGSATCCRRACTPTGPACAKCGPKWSACAPRTARQRRTPSSSCVSNTRTCA